MLARMLYYGLRRHSKQLGAVTEGAEPCSLANMSVEQLRKVLGGKGLARMAHNFFHKEPTSAEL